MKSPTLRSDEPVAIERMAALNRGGGRALLHVFFPTGPATAQAPRRWWGRSWRLVPTSTRGRSGCATAKGCCIGRAAMTTSRSSTRGPISSMQAHQSTTARLCLRLSPGGAWRPNPEASAGIDAGDHAADEGELPPRPAELSPVILAGLPRRAARCCAIPARACADLNWPAPWSGQTPLAIAEHGAHRNVVDWLLKEGRDPWGERLSGVAGGGSWELANLHPGAPLASGILAVRAECTRIRLYHRQLVRQL